MEWKRYIYDHDWLKYTNQLSAAEGKAVILHVDSDFETIGSVVGLKNEKIDL